MGGTAAGAAGVDAAGLCRAHERTQPVAKPSRRPRFQRRYTSTNVELLAAVDEAREQIHNFCISLWLRRMGARLKIKSLHAAERDIKTSRKQREEFLEKIRSIEPEHLVFIDDSSVTTAMTRLYGCSVGGRRIYEGTPDSRWSILTIISDMSYRGMIATMTIKEAI